jgi:hypothetical protein
MSGAASRHRTSDAWVFGPSLYQLSYRGKNCGGLYGDRTRDHILDREVLYLLS